MDIAVCYLEQGKLNESAQLYQQALDGRMKVLGIRQVDTAWACNNAAVVLEKLGDISAALALQEKALRSQTELLGEKHEFTQWTRDAVNRLRMLRTLPYRKGHYKVEEFTAAVYSCE